MILERILDQACCFLWHSYTKPPVRFSTQSKSWLTETRRLCTAFPTIRLVGLKWPGRTGLFHSSVLRRLPEICPNRSNPSPREEAVRECTISLWLLILISQRLVCTLGRIISLQRPIRKMGKIYSSSRTGRSQRPIWSRHCAFSIIITSGCCRKNLQ